MLIRVLILLLLSIETLSARTYYGKVIGVTDGDTIKLLVKRQWYKIRLAEIDTPEKRQAYGKSAKNVLSKMIYNRNVRVEQDTVDRYGRIIGRVYLGETYINAVMVQKGYAWVYRKYSNNPKLIRLEKEAREKRLGLWAGKNPIPPWNFRRGKKGSSSSRTKNRMKPPSFNCGKKTYCYEMSSCREARYYFRNCKLSRLDRDRDGIPCEKLCR